MHAAVVLNLKLIIIDLIAAVIDLKLVSLGLGLRLVDRAFPSDFASFDARFKGPSTRFTHTKTLFLHNFHCSSYAHW
jgi:hypothetical protein